jgi:hypothetical protein
LAEGGTLGKGAVGGASAVASARRRLVWLVMTRSRRWLMALLLSNLALPVGIWQVGALIEMSGERDNAQVARSAGTAGDEAVTSDPLRGIWQRWAADGEEDRVRFYYFHGDGHGLYRYGKVGLTNTHSFDYAVEGEAVRLRFRRTGEEHRLPFSIAADPEVAGREWLTLDADPREPGARYFRDPVGAAAGEREDAAAQAGLGDRLWGDERRLAGGGLDFAIYQLQAQTIDGRGVGWFHRGDYDEWTTEALTYRRRGDHLTIHFMLEGRSATSSFKIEEAEGARFLELAEDPRDFWRAHRYRDMGRSFAGALWSPSASGLR